MPLKLFLSIIGASMDMSPLLIYPKETRSTSPRGRGGGGKKKKKKKGKKKSAENAEEKTGEITTNFDSRICDLPDDFYLHIMNISDERCLRLSILMDKLKSLNILTNNLLAMAPPTDSKLPPAVQIPG